MAEPMGGAGLEPATSCLQGVREAGLSAQELDRRPEARQEYAPLIRAAIETGARLGELPGSNCSDLLDEDVWNVERQWTKHNQLVRSASALLRQAKRAN